MRAMRHQLGLIGAFPVSIDRAHLNIDPARVFNPSASGAINFLNMSVDGQNSLVFDNTHPLGNATITTRQYFAVRQNGIVYVANAPPLSQNFSNAAWAAPADPTAAALFAGAGLPGAGRLTLKGLTAANFTPLGGGANPNFSPTGAPIQFGFVRGNDSGTFVDVFHDADNFYVEVDYTLAALPRPVVVPKPPTTMAATDADLAGTTGGHHDLVNERLHGGSNCAACTGASAGSAGASSFADEPTMTSRGYQVFAAALGDVDSGARSKRRGGAVSRSSNTLDAYVPRWTAFAVFGGSWGHSGATANQSGFTSSGTNGVFGLDRMLGADLLVGVAYGFGRVDGSYYNGGGSHALDSNTVSAHGSWMIGKTTYVDAVVSHTWASLAQNRVVLADTYSARFDARATAASATLGHDQRLNSWLLAGGSVGIMASHSSIDGYRVSSSAVVPGFNVPGRTSDSVKLKAGIRASTPLYYYWGTIVPQVGFGVSHELRDQATTLTLLTTDTSTPVPATINNPNATRYSVNGGLGMTFGQRTLVGLSASHTWASGFESTGVSGRVRMRF
jgi:outer membrane autotransporter protein